MESKLVEINEIFDHRGKLIVLEENTLVPFDFKRIFYIYGNTANISRGSHAHYKTRQALIALSGSCTVSLDNLKRETEVLLNSPNKVLILEPNDWHEMYNFSKDCILLVLASHLYDSEDYIRDYEQFVSIYKFD